MTKQPHKKSNKTEGATTSPPDRSPHGKPDKGFSLFSSQHRTWLILGVILLLGLVLRLAYLGEIKDAPDFSAPLADAAFHDYWARALLTDEWTPPAGVPDPRIQEVPFLRPPGYPYFLAGSYALTGRSYTGARVVQIILGLVNCVLAFFLGRALFNRSIGLIMAAFCAMYWALLYFEGELHAPVLILTLSLVLMLLLVRWASRPLWVTALVAGIVLGLLAVLRANFLLFAPVAAGWLIWFLRSQGSTGQGVRHALLLLLGVLLAVVPVTIRNVMVADDLFLISANGAINLYIGNNEESDGFTPKIPDLPELGGVKGWSCFSYDSIVQLLSQEQGFPMKYSDVSRHFMGKAFEFIKDNPLKAVQLTLKRAAMFWGPDEISNNKAIAYEKYNSPTLRFIPGFPLVLALSLVGLYLLWRGRKAGSSIDTGIQQSVPARAGLLLVGIFVLALFVSYLPFIMASRFRAPLVPFIFVFGALAVYRLGIAVRDKNWKPAGLLIGATALLTVLTNYSLTGYEVDPAWWHTDRAVAYQRQGLLKEAEAEYKEALAANPGFVDAYLNYGNLLYEQNQKSRAIKLYETVAVKRPERLDVRVRLVDMLTDSDHSDRAVVEARRILEINPNFPEAHFALGRALMRQRKYEEAIEVFRHYVTLRPEEPATYLNLGIALVNLNRPEEAITEISTALMKNPNLEGATFWLGKAYVQSGNVDKAVLAFQKELRTNPKSTTALMNLGMLYSNQGDYVKSAEWFARASLVAPDDLVVKHNLAGALANAGDYEASLEVFQSILTKDPQNRMAQQRIATLQQLMNEQPKD